MINWEHVVCCKRQGPAIKDGGYKQLPSTLLWKTACKWWNNYTNFKWWIAGLYFPLAIKYWWATNGKFLARCSDMGMGTQNCQHVIRREASTIRALRMPNVFIWSQRKDKASVIQHQTLGPRVESAGACIWPWAARTDDCIQTVLCCWVNKPWAAEGCQSGQFGPSHWLCGECGWHPQGMAWHVVHLSRQPVSIQEWHLCLHCYAAHFC